MEFATIRMRIEPPVCIIRFDQPVGRDGINATLVDECRRALDQAAEAVHIVVLEGSPEIFCLGADFEAYMPGREPSAADPEALYSVWHQLASGPFVSIARVRGKAHAGGVGFAAACDIVLADQSAEFSLPELLFGLVPACVLPFLIRRIGHQRAHYMTLSTRPISVQQALEWGLVDAWADDSEDLLRKHLLRLRRLPKAGVGRYKAYMSGLNPILTDTRSAAVDLNRALFSDPDILEAIRRFARAGLFPWQD
jgi:polyketide biosynthesis enoyl-CoA hydratase PksH